MPIPTHTSHTYGMKKVSVFTSQKEKSKLKNKGQHGFN